MARHPHAARFAWFSPSLRMGKAEPFRVPSSGPALDLLKELCEGAQSAFLFRSNRNGQHLTDVALSKVLNGLDEPGRIHGFRTSFRTWCQDIGAPFDVAEMELAHTVSGKVEPSYARSDLLEQRSTLMQRWADFVTGKRRWTSKRRPNSGNPSARSRGAVNDADHFRW